jgi:hypothetical protein
LALRLRLPQLDVDQWFASQQAQSIACTRGSIAFCKVEALFLAKAVHLIREIRAIRGQSEFSGLAQSGQFAQINPD